MQEKNKYIFNSKYQDIYTKYCIIEISYIDDEITEIGLMKIENGKQIDRFQSIIKPEKNIEKSNNTNNKTRETAPKIEEILPKIIDFIGDDVVIFYNGDINFKILNKTYQKHNYEFNNTYIDILKLLKAEYKPFSNYEIKAIAKEFDIFYSDNLKNGILERMLLVKYIFNIIVEDFTKKNYYTIGDNKFEKFSLLFYANKAPLLNNYMKIEEKYPELLTEIQKYYRIGKKPEHFKIEHRINNYFTHEINNIKDNYIKQLPFKLEENDDRLYKHSKKTSNKLRELSKNNDMYEKDLCKEIWFTSYYGKTNYPIDIIDIQTPLKPARKYKYGEIDITGVDIDEKNRIVIYLIEAKPLSTKETLLRAVVESVTYRYIIEDNIERFIDDFKKYIVKYDGQGEKINKIKQMLEENKETKIITKSMILVPEKLYKDHKYSKIIYDKYKTDIDFYVVDYDKKDLKYPMQDEKVETLFKEGKYPEIYKYNK